MLNHSLQFKFRAECSYDVILYLEAVSKECTLLDADIKGTGGGVTDDCETTIKVVGFYETLKRIAQNTTDCHVIAQTIQPLHLYTGIRL